MPALVRQGPFSYDSNGYSATRTYNLVKATFVADKGDILEVVINGVKIVGEGANAVGDEFTVNSLTNPTSITVATTFTTNDPGTSVALVFTTGTIIVKRLSNRSTPVVDFAPGSVIRETDLDSSTNQTLHVAQEAMDIAISGMVLAANDKFDGKSKVIENVANPVNANDAVNKTYLENTWLTSTDKTNSATVAGISAHVTTVAGISANVTAVAGDATDIGVVAGKATEIGLLGTSAMATASTGHLARLGNATVTEDMALLGLAPVIEDMSLLGTADVIEDMALLGLAPVIADMAILATNPIVADMAILGTDDIVADMAILGSTTVTDDMALLAVPAVIDDMALLGATGVIADMDLLGATGVIADLAAVTATGVIDDLETVANNLTNVNNFADTYQIDDFSPSAPTTDGGSNALAAGDLAFDTTANQMKVWDGSAFGVMGLTQANATTTANNAAVAMAIALG
jgi:hypothetical protein